ncbi:hypothetical protein DICPUDRAFT_36629 [Dictyostelium purpureum]|uniref:Uncharacterized protein n=1 Tax=Dictyostelium purpureum TaxID=5786 RepID=F0ZRC9_DICPU|nr:uncharacterized protein DICPUDRAFT_36629 [Dictyostelium purpureum]EGC33493.1 hypothetical protein DICPUDRAFT_36629 [Dictyostelium purpureum]|eukprot:XP_003289967.1 hypothetical protein DICPUDRAFT_36629 [Dictyostelium purpureum]
MDNSGLENASSTSTSTTTTNNSGTATSTANINNNDFNDTIDTSKENFIAPPTIKVIPFINSRKKEIKEFMKMVQTKKSNSRSFQTLPRYLRRRTMSHNVYRLPVHLRKKGKYEMEKSATSSGGNLTKEKKMVRKSKRRPSYLLRDYERRQKQFKWLETHIWHAKRMKMLNLWGHKIAKSINRKGVRSTFRASSHLSTIYDSSYFNCIEIKGTESNIINFFKRFTDPNSISISNKGFLNGSREGSIDLYYTDRFPFHFICPTRFLWKQEIENDNKNVNNKERMIWIWIHPAALNEITFIFEKNAGEYNLNINNLEHGLQRFELTGSKSHAVLNSILFLRQDKDSVNNNSNQLDSNHVWELLNSLRTPATLPKGTVISLKVHDPRLACKIPTETALSARTVSKPQIKKQQTAQPTQQHSINQIIVNWTHYCKQVAVSDLWCSEKRSSISKNIEPNNSVNQRRKNLKDFNEIGSKYSSPSIMLVQRDGGLTRGYGSGWDIIVPAGWGLAFWIPLIYSGAWSIGLEDRDRFLLEQGLPSYPKDFPDCKAGIEYNQLLAFIKQEKYNRTPKSKKINYLKNSIFFPFSPYWEWVLKFNKNEILDFNISGEPEQKEEESEKEENKEIEHKSKKLKNIIGTEGEVVLKSQPYFVYRGKLALSLIDPDNYPVMKNSTYIPFDQEYINKPNDRGLLRVSIKMFHRGKPLPNSVIYEPLESDVELLQYKYYKRDYSPIQLESPKLKKLKKPSTITTNDLFEYYDQMGRKPIGFVTNGEQSLARGFGSGIGYCSATEFVRIQNYSIEKNYTPKGFAFIQNPKSRTLYPVILTIQP